MCIRIYVRMHVCLPVRLSVSVRKHESIDHPISLPPPRGSSACAPSSTEGSGPHVQGSGCRVQGVWSQGLGFRVQGLGCAKRKRAFVVRLAVYVSSHK